MALRQLFIVVSFKQICGQGVGAIVQEYDDTESSNYIRESGLIYVRFISKTREKNQQQPEEPKVKTVHLAGEEAIFDHHTR